ncbi:hypothetical protein GX48_00786 [Paracoccidioides brasiliensis]|nr:hypothetical protein GX48_00786 [Paracoccidioides brasiliensis]
MNTSREFDESRKMMQNLEVVEKMSDRKNTSGESSGGSAAKTMGSISSSPRPSGAVSILVARTGEEETREQKPVSGFEQWCSPQSSKPRTPVGNNDQSPVSEPNGMETGDLIDVSIPDEDTCNIASAFKVLMDNVKNQSQPGEGETEVNKMIEQSVSADTTLMDSDHAKITVHNIGKAITPSHGQRTAESSHRSGMEAVETISARASHGSEVSGGYYVSQLESAALAKKNYHTTPVEGLEVAKAIDPSHTYKAFAIMQPEPTGVGSVCYGCGDTFNSVVSLQLHQMANEHNYCKLCLSFFSDNSLFKFHIQKMHTFKCAACHLTFKDQEERMQHQRETGHAHCKDCSGYFLDQKSLSKHHEIHNRTKFSCPLCSSVFKTEMGKVLRSTSIVTGVPTDSCVPRANLHIKRRKPALLIIKQSSTASVPIAEKNSRMLRARLNMRQSTTPTSAFWEAATLLFRHWMIYWSITGKTISIANLAIVGSVTKQRWSLMRKTPSDTCNQLREWYWVQIGDWDKEIGHHKMS